MITHATGIMVISLIKVMTAWVSGSRAKTRLVSLIVILCCCILNTVAA